ncbi:STAS domain-containing protein [Heyndrickxia coagulans]|uniref:STAS domain-containing protein n=1 Tax=Heyndrickxia coagulans TaxID=1398 RepID=UPI0002F653F7|nr:STAS domain-containing protein [Heyndrickxia coagulans]MCR2847687.1 STAS domain-containing protein [Heyndrickxia coagulans]MDR4225434.1 STAS domain-containing protein [Heyndrickxia coagulans DSM 1 = ATCC 7050]MED4493781.1 STAS domain-containing protein [Heyndrickxia coagulans]MED4537636.1 STAS domain-containing protein [Heyndrickxia coagulans]MED4963356.1 STAS domain-containing protein [Heyndrickxia coagulans]
MELRQALHQFFLEKTWQLTEDWYASLDKSTVQGVYASTDPEVVAKLKEQNHEFHVQFCEVFLKDEDTFLHHFEKWVMNVAQDEEHLSTPNHFIFREFFHTQEQYLDLFDSFVAAHEGKYTYEELNFWRRAIIRTFEHVMLWFMKENHHYSLKRLESQQEMIKELSSPVIMVGKNTALLPLVGEIDSNRAKIILEKTLEQCAEKSVLLLYIDLSGVVVIDTMVAQQIFRLIETLRLIGVKSILSGIRPEVAQTAIQLGIDFNDVTIHSKLELMPE